MLYTRVPYESFERWESKLLELEKSRPGDRELARKTAAIRGAMEESKQALARCRSKVAEWLWAVRAFSRATGVAPPDAGQGGAPKDQPPSAIRFVDAAAGPCVQCGKDAGAGPVGWREDREPGPLCDPCFIDANEPLGAMVGLANFLREAAEVSWIRQEEEMALQFVLSLMGGLQEASTFEKLGRRPIDLERELLPLLKRLEAAHAAAKRGDSTEALIH